MSQQVHILYTQGGRNGEAERMHWERADAIVAKGQAKHISRSYYKMLKGLPLSAKQKQSLKQDGLL